MKGQTTTITNEQQECCEGLEPAGLRCSCGRHFHVGTSLLEDEERLIECPSCESGSLVSDLAGTVKLPAPDVVVEILCQQVEPAVAERIRNVAKTRKTSDPNYWSNVMLRESWYVEHGGYDGWDEAARAGGQDPAIYGPAT